MTPRERVKAAMRYRPVDKAPLQYYYTPVGYFEHGEKLNDLYATLPGDFEPFYRHEPCGPGPGDYDPDGSYHAFKKDEWGTLWEYRIYGIAGIPKQYPIPVLEEIDRYTLPDPPRRSVEAQQAVCRNQGEYYTLVNAHSLIERLRQLLPDDEVYCGIELDDPAINRLADKICAYNAVAIEQAIAAGADGIQFGDDYGAEKSMLLSPETWRRFFKPRLKELFAPAVKSGLDIHFHSCGKIEPILEDLREVGATSIWPQLPAYDMKQLADTCRSLGLAVAIHTDRANTMTFGTPADGRELVLREFETFKMMDGGSWFYVEADNGFPFENLRALVETIAQWR